MHGKTASDKKLGTRLLELPIWLQFLHRDNNFPAFLSFKSCKESTILSKSSSCPTPIQTNSYVTDRDTYKDIEYEANSIQHITYLS